MTLDGLRGFLAFGVFFQHAATYHALIVDGIWTDPPRFYLLLGQVGVVMFFMITGYLFWSKLLSDNGRPHWVKFYIGRVFRIAPVYLLAVLVMLLIVFASTGFHLNVSPADLIMQISRWLAIGVNGGGADVNGFAGTRLILFGVTWTLASEWKFYLALLPLSFIARSKTYNLPILGTLLLACLCYSLVFPDRVQAAASIRACFFLIGMVCASLERQGLLLTLPDTAMSAATALLVAAIMTFATGAYTVTGSLALGVVFYLVISGSSVFGLLSSSAARRLGDVSYSTYLLQGVVVTLLMALPGLKSYAAATPLHHWSVVATCAAALLLASTISALYVERPGIDLGRRCAAAVARSWQAMRGRSRALSGH